MEFNLADLYESVADRVPEREAVVWGDTRLTFRQLDERATRLAHGLQALGVGPRSHVGILTYSRPEYLETMLAAFKIRAVPINVNYRYVADELAYLFANADLVALVLESTFAPVVASLRGRLPRLAHVIVVDDGTDGASALPDADTYEDLVAAHAPASDFPTRSGEDAYIVYTGGTTGNPKGVVWRQEDIFFATMTPGVQVERPEDVAANAASPVHPRLKALAEADVELPAVFISYSLGPLMHASGHWSAWGAMLSGGCTVLHPTRQMDAGTVLDVVAREHVTMLTIVGDSMGRPLAEALETEPGRYDTSSVLMLGSGGSILSAEVKERLLAGFPSVMALIEAIGSSESPSQALSVTARGHEPGETLRFSAKEGTTIFDDQLRPVEPGSGVVGRLATTGRVPIGYYNDAEKSAQTFVTVDGVRWALPGDMAVLEADHSIRLLGRGSMCINTGGEKVYPEEVEAVLMGYDGIVDAVIVGTPEPRFGQQVAAVVEAAPGGPVPTLEEVQDYCRAHLAGHKVPRQLFVVDKVPRSPSGKPDYAWATEVARSGTAAAGGSP